MKLNKEQIEGAIRQLIVGMGEDPNEEPYKGTENRFYRFLEEVFGDTEKEIKTFPEDNYCGPVTITDHEAWSLCPHHLLPTRFVINVTYVPRDCSVLGLSKLPRLINHIVKEGPALQERVTQRIIEVLKEYSIETHVVIRGEHLCTKMRGVKSTGSMVTELRWVDQAVLMQKQREMQELQQRAIAQQGPVIQRP